MSEIYNSSEELIGSTPLLRLCKVEKKLGLKARILAKLEFKNPAGSVKDRVARAMIDDAEASGRLKKGGVIIEPTSGNTGIAIAAVAAARGYKAVIVMPESMSEERRKLIKAYGAELVLTDKAKGMKGAIERADEIAQTTPNSIIAGQFVNPANPAEHYKTTGPEIYAACGKEADFLVAGVGTGGTISGAGKYLKEKISVFSVVAVEPATSAVLSGEPAGSHGIMGIGAGFIPKTLDLSVVDKVVKVTDDEAYSAARIVSFTEGVLVGISSGAAAHAAIQLAQREENAGKTIVVIFPDGGDRYLSTPLYQM